MKTTTTITHGETKITTTRRWDYNSVRTCCIHHDLYTCGTCEEYEKMFKLIEVYEPTVDGLYIVAQDITEHSEDQTVENVMFLLERDAVTTFYDIEKIELPDDPYEDEIDERFEWGRY